MLQRPKIADAQDKSKECLDAMVADGSANADTYKKMGKWEANLDRRVLTFVEKGPTYNGNPKEVFNWCEKVRRSFV